MKTAILLLIASLFTVATSFAAESNKSAEAKPEPAASALVNSKQTFVLKGRVVDTDAQSLAGASIIVAGKKLYTDLDGNFSVTLDGSSRCELKASMISFEEQQLEVSPNSGNLVIRMKQ